MSNAKTHNTGQILNVYLPSRIPQGHEQEGMRPCVLLANPSEVQLLRFPVLIIAPMTTQSLDPLPLYPRLEKGTGGLPMDSTVLLDLNSSIQNISLISAVTLRVVRSRMTRIGFLPTLSISRILLARSVLSSGDGLQWSL